MSERTRAEASALRELSQMMREEGESRGVRAWVRM